MSIKVETHIEILEVNGNEVEVGKSRKIVVRNHWNYSRERVVLKVGKDEVTVKRRDLERAIQNACNQ